MGAAETASGFFPVAGDLINGKYEIERLLGRGGMGAVFSAHNRLTGRRVALKWVLPERDTPSSRERLLREAQATCAVDHPNVVQVYDVCEHRGGLFIVMEYLDGQSLADVLERRGPFDPAELIAMLMPAMRGVQAAHEAGVIHRDLKPDNILLCPVTSGEVLPKVLDFGVSKTFHQEREPDTSLTHTGALVGTPHFMALEQINGSGDIDIRTDVYAFGVILYLGLTGKHPFDGDSLGDLILQIGTRTPLSIRAHRPHLPGGLDRVVQRAMSRPREQRYSSMRQLAEALEPFGDGVRFLRESADTSGRALPMRMPARSFGSLGGSPRLQPRTRSLAVAALVALVLGLGSWFAAQHRGVTPRAEPSAPESDAVATKVGPPPAAPIRLPHAAPPHAEEDPRPVPRLDLELSPEADLPAATEPAEATPTRREEDPVPKDVTPAKKGAPGDTPRRDTRRLAPQERPESARAVAPEPEAMNEERIRGQRTPGLSASDF